MGGLMLGVPPYRCTEMGGGGSGGSANTAGSAGAEAGTTSGGSDGGTGGTGNGGSAGTTSGAGVDSGGTAAGGTDGGSGGTGPSGGGASGMGGGGTGGISTPLDCPVGSFAVVGKASCFECPGYVYEQAASTCATLASDVALHSYDAATHELRLRAGDGMPLPQAGWSFSSVTPTFDTPPHQSACAAQPSYAVDGTDYVVDLSGYTACTGLTDLVLFDLLPSYGCAESIPNRTSVSLRFVDGSPSLSLECASPNPLPPVLFGNLTPIRELPRYDVSTAGVVTDNQTGLVWQQLADGSYPSLMHPDAEAHCLDLDYGGESDWRLPTAYELFTLVQLHSGSSNHHDPNAFPNSPAGGYWTRSPYPFFGEGWAMIVIFDSYESFMGFPAPTVVGADPTTPEYAFEHPVRCVRSGLSPSPRYTTNHDGIALDNRTGLVWEQPLTVGVTAAQAQARCRDLALAGGGWRVPTMVELLSVHDYGDEEYPPLDTSSSSGLWSASPYTESPPGTRSGWVLGFDGGSYAEVGGANRLWDTRCVR